MSAPAPLGAVLCGGASRRMGRDKARLAVDGTPMAERVAAALVGGGCDEAVLIGGDGPALTRAIPRRWVPDRWPGEGPLGGLLTAMAVAGERPVVVAACDLVDLDADTVRTLVDAGPTAAADGAAAVVAVTAHPHLLGWWPATTEPAVRALFDAGERGVRRALRHLRVLEVSVPVAAVRNVNTPDDLPRGAEPGRPGGADYVGSMAVPEIEVDEFASRHAEGVRLVDVREPHEYAAGHVPGAVSVPLTSVSDRLGEIGPGDGPIYVICQAGGRSRSAAEQLAEAGYDVVNVGGGTGAWVASGRAVVGGDQPT